MATRTSIDEIVSRPYKIRFEHAPEPESGVVAYVLEWLDCLAAGRDSTEALAALKRSMRELAAYRLEHGLEIPSPGSP